MCSVAVNIKIKIRTRKRIRSRSNIQAAGLPFSSSRVEFLLIGPIQVLAIEPAFLRHVGQARLLILILIWFV